MSKEIAYDLMRSVKYTPFQFCVYITFTDLTSFIPVYYVMFTVLLL